MCIGIYMIKNISNNKVYIGQSVDIHRRWNDHKAKLRNNKHENAHLQTSYNKYGDENFEFTILCECLKNELNDKELFFIKKYNSHNPSYGYNHTMGGNENISFTQETIEKMIKSHSNEFVKICKYSLEQQLLHIYDSLSEASRDVNGTPSGIRNCANKFSYNIGLSKTYKNYIWIYEHDRKRFEECDIQKYLHKELSIPINKYKYPSGEFVCTYETVSLAALDNNISNDVVSMCVRGAQKQSDGFTYRNANQFSNETLNIQIKKRKKKKPVIAYYANSGEFAMYIDDENVLKENGFDSGHINECCNGKRKTHKGYIWKFADEQFAQYFCEDGIKQIEQKSLSDM